MIAQGRSWYQKAADSPDNLAEHPAVAATVGRPWDNPLFYEVVNYAASQAFERVSGDEHGFWDALSARDERDRAPADMGEDFDFDDEQEMRRRLPRLAALCLGDNDALCRTGSSEAAQRTSHRSPGNDPNRQAPLCDAGSWRRSDCSHKWPRYPEAVSGPRQGPAPPGKAELAVIAERIHGGTEGLLPHARLDG